MYVFTSELKHLRHKLWPQHSSTFSSLKLNSSTLRLQFPHCRNSSWIAEKPFSFTPSTFIYSRIEWVNSLELRSKRTSSPEIKSFCLKWLASTFMLCQVSGTGFLFTRAFNAWKTSPYFSPTFSQVLKCTSTSSASSWLPQSHENLVTEVERVSFQVAYI